jgi:hypothetical protein
MHTYILGQDLPAPVMPLALHVFIRGSSNSYCATEEPPSIHITRAAARPEAKSAGYARTPIGDNEAGFHPRGRLLEIRSLSLVKHAVRDPLPSCFPLRRCLRCRERGLYIRAPCKRGGGWLRKTSEQREIWKRLALWGMPHVASI